MKKGKRSNGKELRREYKHSDFPRGFVRGKYASRLGAGSNIVRLDPEIASAFPTSEGLAAGHVIMFPHGNVHALASTPGLRALQITTAAGVKLTRADSIARA